MSVVVTVAGTSFTIPQTSETGWGAQVTAWIQKVSNSTFQSNGGPFTLTAEADFGGSFGLKALYFSSRTTNTAGTGVFRLATGESVVWRNSDNTGVLSLTNFANLNLPIASGTSDIQAIVPESGDANFAIGNTVSNGRAQLYFLPNSGSPSKILVGSGALDFIMSGANPAASIAATGQVTLGPASGVISSHVIRAGTSASSIPVLDLLQTNSGNSSLRFNPHSAGDGADFLIAGTGGYNWQNSNGFNVLRLSDGGSLSVIAQGTIGTNANPQLTLGDTNSGAASGATFGFFNNQNRLRLRPGSATVGASILTFQNASGGDVFFIDDGSITIKTSTASPSGTNSIVALNLAGGVTGGVDFTKSNDSGGSPTGEVSIYSRTSGTTAEGVRIGAGGATKIRAFTDGSDAPAGIVGEYFTSGVGSAGGAGTGQFFDIASITLTAGDWDLTGFVDVDAHLATSPHGFYLGISTTSGNSNTGLTLGDNFYGLGTPAGFGDDFGGSIPGYRRNITSTTTFYLKGQSSYTGTAPAFRGRLSARRIR